MEKQGSVSGVLLSCKGNVFRKRGTGYLWRMAILAKASVKGEMRKSTSMTRIYADQHGLKHENKNEKPRQSACIGGIEVGSGRTHTTADVENHPVIVGCVTESSSRMP